VGLALAGPVSALVGVRPTIVGAAVVVAVATLTTLAVPSVRNLRQTGVAAQVSSPSPLPAA
jgi:hypothetical protein